MEKNNNQTNITTIVIIVILLIIIGVILFSFFKVGGGSLELTKNQVRINDHTINVFVVQTPEEQIIGLSETEKLSDNEGMLFIYEDKRYRNFWMKDMNFPLDMIWIDDDTIVDITKNAPLEEPNQTDYPTYRPQIEVNYVIEVNAGYIDKNDIKIGDKVEINI